MQGELKGNRTSSNNHGKHWVGTDGNDQAQVMYMAQDNRIPKGSRKTNGQSDRVCATRKTATCKALPH